MAAIVSSPQQVNLFNAALIPTRQRFSVRQLFGWIALAVVALVAVAWWASTQMRSLRQQIAQEAARPRATVADQGPTPQQLATLEQALRGLQTQIASREATLQEMKRGIAGPAGGPAGVMRALAQTIPESAWLLDVNIAGGRIDIKAKALEPAAVEAWLERLRSSGVLAERPAATLKLDRIDAAAGPANAPTAYAVQATATLAKPFAEPGGRP